MLHLKGNPNHEPQLSASGTCRQRLPGNRPNISFLTGLCALLVLVTLSGSAALGQHTDALVLQQTAVTRYKGLREQYLRTLDVKPIVQSLELIDTELARSVRLLRESADEAHVAAGLVMQGNVRRLLGQNAQAEDRYAEAVAAARRAGHLGMANPPSTDLCAAKACKCT